MKNFKFIIPDYIAFVFVFFLTCFSPFLTAYGILYRVEKENNAGWPDEIKSPMKPSGKIIAACVALTFLYYGLWFSVVTFLKHIS
ncbi:MAG: hypothetical protein M0P12_11620 [Paludibacteraceae bacterium]|nr:hypothetical protein [Paludibacteraceae bacterium]MCK9616029.1 hypothetical protein [Candidatus Omnitrophota bacterium]